MTTRGGHGARSWGIVLKEEFTATHALGFAVILAGVWLANRRFGGAPWVTRGSLSELDTAA